VPRRIVVDENGIVVSVQSIPERTNSAPSNASKNGKTKVKKGKTTPRVAWTPSKKHKVGKGIGDWARPKISCPVCNAYIQERRLAKHLRKAHPNYIAGRPSPAVSERGASETITPPKVKNPAPARKPDDKSLVRCLVCNSSVREDRLARHLSKVHRSGFGVASPAAAGGKLGSADNKAGASNRTFGKATSNQTGRAVRGTVNSLKEISKQDKNDRVEKLKEEIRNIDRSLRKLAPGFHRVKIEELQRKRSLLLKELRRPQEKRKSVSTRTRRKTAGPSRAKSEQHEEVLRQSRGEEGSYGGKYLGQMRRERDGRFGSLPLYDDYGEESGPD